MNRIQFIHDYKDIISLENLLAAWEEFVNGKHGKKDVQQFELRLLDNICNLHSDLKNKTYSPGAYHAFKLNDPKPRDIHKASIRDRLLHHAIHRKLYPFFNRIFISDSYSCREQKGTHGALTRFKNFGYILSKNHTQTVWVLKCDIRKFFASVDQHIMIESLHKYIPDQDIMSLLSSIIGTFYTTQIGKGLPLGNLTSQLSVNIYMNTFDHYMKHNIKAKYYIRYTDDFVILSTNHKWLENVLVKVNIFLEEKLKLSLHPDKVLIRTLASGVDFLGWIHFPDHKVLRTITKKRMLRKINDNPKPEIIASYLGLLKHGNTNKLKKEIQNPRKVID